MKKFLRYFILILVVLNIIIVASGSTFIYKALYYNFAGIDDYSIFENRTIIANSPQLWAVGTNINKVKLNSSFEKQLTDWETVAFLVIKDDSIRTEYYWDNYSDTSHSGSFSMAKSIVSILVGCALKDGSIKSLDQPVADFIPEFKTNDKQKITIRHLLEMSAGLKWNEAYANPLSITTKAYYGNDLYKLVIDLPVETEPGKIFNYQSCNSQLLGIVVSKATGKNLSEYASEKLWTPIGAEHEAWWSLDHNNGIEKAYCCFNSNARDFARLGKLYLNHGNWNGVQIVDSGYVEASIHPNKTKLADGTSNQRYGLHWWCINRGGHDIFFARGILGQYVFVIPDKKIIAVRLGKKRGEHTPDGHTEDIHVILDEVLKMNP